jgi:pimeloyl-ACP methyl ester carboxylesterase
MKTAIDHILALQNEEVRKRNPLDEDEWKRIEAPALVVASGKDHNEYENTSRRVAVLMPNAELLEMPHVKHWPHRGSGHVQRRRPAVPAPVAMRRHRR